MRYYEKLATKLFKTNPVFDYSGEANELLDAAFELAKETLGEVKAMYYFRYDEDFSSDVVTAYANLVENTHTVS